jgi:tocopherol cyclase
VINLLKKKLNPTWYQGIKNNSQHFEGWYFKIVDKDQHNLYAIIPGIFIDKNKTDSHSFIQIFNGLNNKTYYYRFPIEDFRSKDYDFNIQINSNSFSSNTLFLDLSNSSLKIKGELNFENLIQWPKTLVSPGIMGWYTWVPFMECYHGIISLNHKIQGYLNINGQDIDFSNGKGYTEKDWGKSFPEAWIWCQSNHFNTENVSCTGSIAIIPWINKPFLGFIFGLWYKNKLYRFTTYTGAKLIHLEMEESKIKSIFEQKDLTLEIIINRSNGGFLQAPTINGMTHQISESMKSTIEIKLSKKSIKKSEIIFKDTGRHAGFEITGDVKRLIEMYKKLKS